MKRFKSSLIYTILLIFILAFSISCDDDSGDSGNDGNQNNGNNVTNNNNNSFNNTNNSSGQYYAGAKVINSETDLPACTSDSDGQLYYLQSLQEFRFCDGTNYQLIDLTGPAGANGANGADGVNGADGADGANGTNGLNGADGSSIQWQGTHAAAPADCNGAALNYAYYNSTANTAYVCDGSSWQILSKDGTNGTNGESGPPFIVYAAPTDTQKSVTRDSLITVVFNKEIDPSTLSDTTFYITDNHDLKIEGTINYTNQVATFTPQDFLNIYGEYTINVSGVSDTVGNQMIYTFNSIFRVVDGQWRSVIHLEPGNSLNSFTPELSINKTGEALAIWCQNSTGEKVYGAYYNPETGWNTPQLIDSRYSGSFPLHQRIAIDDDGNGLAIWIASYDNSHKLITSRYTKGGGWSEATIIEEISLASIKTKAIKFDNMKNATALFIYGSDLYVRQYINGSGWQPKVLIKSSSNYIADAKLGIDATGNMIVVWVEYDMTNYHIGSNTYTAGSGWNTPVSIINNISSPYLQLAINKNGKAIIVWQHYESTNHNVYAKQYSSGSWQSTQAIESSSDNALYPDVAINVAGDAIVVWIQDDGTRKNLYAKTYTEGVEWSEPLLLEYNDATIDSKPTIVLADTGNAMAIWKQTGDVYENVYAARYTVITGWLNPQIIDQGDGDINSDKIIAKIHDNGNVYALWVQDDSSQDSVHMNIFK